MSRVAVRRGGLVESVHRVHVAVSDGATLVRGSGDPGLRVFLRSVAKPFQSVPLVEDGVVAALGLTEEELAVTAASHSSESGHLRAARRILHACGTDEAALACGPHTPFDGTTAARLERAGAAPGRIHNNCSGKHAGMIALARHNGWPVHGYQGAGHAVQVRMAREVGRWCDVPVEEIPHGVDGCGVATFALSLADTARGFARLGRAAAERDEGPAAVVRAMTAHPWFVGGTGRLCTEIMERSDGRLLVKVGAEGMYCACAPDAGLGLALKVEDGARRASEMALVAVLEDLGLLDGQTASELHEPRARISNTRGTPVGTMATELSWSQ